MRTQAQILDFKLPTDISAGAALAGVWESFIDSVDAIDGDYHNAHEQQAVINHNLVLMHKLLLSCRDYRQLINSAGQRLPRTKYSGWKTMHEDDLGRVGLLTLFRDAQVPLHDHPGKAGALLLLQGELAIERYSRHRRHHGETVPHSGLVTLQRCDQQVLKPYQASCFGCRHANIHGLEAVSEPCVLLKVELASNADHVRSWYFPLISQVDDQGVVQARRIVSRYL